MSTLLAPDADTFDDGGPITAEGLLRRRAQHKPDAVAVVDPPNRPALTNTQPRSFSYGAADEAVDALARFFIDIGLEPSDRVIMQLPNFIEAPLALLGAWRAGLTVAPVPMLWRSMEIARACDALEAKALVGFSEFADERPAEMLRDVAATRMSVRFVLGFGANLPDGVASLDEVVAEWPRGAVEARAPLGPSLITFTARPDAPLVPLFRTEDEVLAQGAMIVLALALDRSDVLLNAYPFTGPVGLGLGLASWLIGGAALVQHHPFDYPSFVQQIIETGATVTAVPGAILAELAKDGVLGDTQCQLRRIGRIWSAAEFGNGTAPTYDIGRPLFDFVPLGDLAGIVARRNGMDAGALVPLGAVHLGEDGDDAVFVETRLGGDQGEILIRGPIVPEGRSNGPAARDGNGFVSTGLHGAAADGNIHVTRDPELIYHGGFTIAASELDGVYQAFPGFLDAACFVLHDPVIGDRIFGAVAPVPNAPVSLEALHRFLMERGVAPYKFPDKLLVVRDIPRDASGRILRDAILAQI